MGRFRRRLSRAAGFAAGLGLGLAPVMPMSLAFGQVMPAKRAAADRPDIVMIISDDQGFGDFGFMGHPVVRTPNLDRLAASGAFFPRAYVPTSLCRPSLTTLLTGLYPHQHGVCFNDPPPGVDITSAQVLIQSLDTLPRMLGAVGYDSFQTGKFWEGHYRNGGFTAGMTTEGRHGAAGLTIGRETLRPVEEFLDSLPANRRFLLWYAPMLPHTPHDAPQAFRDLYSGRELTADQRAYYANISRLDQTVGELLSLLRQRDRLEDTLILFVVDNGWAVPTGEPGWRYNPRSKNSPFEAGVRTPLLMVWPHKIPARRHEDLVSSIDVVPTLLDAAGAPVPHRLPGLSLLPLARARTDRLPRMAVFGETYLHTAQDVLHPSRNLIYRWIREGDLKLIVPADARGPDYHGGPFLFDLRRDAGETVNLLDRAGSAVQAGRLRRLLDAWWRPETTVPPPDDHTSPLPAPGRGR